MLRPKKVVVVVIVKCKDYRTICLIFTRITYDRFLGQCNKLFNEHSGRHIRLGSFKIPFFDRPKYEEPQILSCNNKIFQRIVDDSSRL